MSSDPRLTVKVLTKDPTRSGADRCLAFRSKRCVRVTWGQDRHRSGVYPRVRQRLRDDPVRCWSYFTKLGKSYTALRIRARAANLRNMVSACSPISQFGIGFCPALCWPTKYGSYPSGSSEPWRRRSTMFGLSGSGSLFWLSPGTLERQGNGDHALSQQPFQLDHDQNGRFAG